jgi:hypothetical protein
MLPVAMVMVVRMAVLVGVAIAGAGSAFDGSAVRRRHEVAVVVVMFSHGAEDPY